MPDALSNVSRVAVIGGGVAGLAAAVDLLDAARTAGLDLRLTVFEKDDAPGGNLRTLRRDGWQLEWGPNGFLDNEPATLRLVDRLGLRDRLQRSSDAARRRFLLVGNRLREIPTSPGAFVRSDLLSLRGKLRMAGELFVPPRKDLGRAAQDPATDETIAEFGVRRLGREFTEIMLDPMVKGVFGGDHRRLSLAAAFPRMVELERDHGGLFKAMIALARRRKNKTDAGPSGVLHSFQGGMAALIEGLAGVLDAEPAAELVCGADIASVGRDADGWRVGDGTRTWGPFDAVIQAAPAHAAAAHLAAEAPELAERLGRIPFAPMAVIALGFARDAVAHDLDGFGMLVPGQEQRDILGALWTSSIFAGRAPEHRVLLRCMAGGFGNPGIMDLDDEALVTLTLAELRPLFGLRGAPEMVQVIRHRRAIAQYVPGHLAGLARIEVLAAERPGLFLTGSSYLGISVNSCVKEAELVAQRVVNHLTGAAGRTPAEVGS